MKGRDKDEPGIDFPRGKGRIYDADDVYQTQLKTDLGQGIWKNCLSLGVDEWVWLVENGAKQVWIVNSKWDLTHKVADFGKVYDRVEDTKNGERFLIPEKPWRMSGWKPPA